ncbi:MAG: AmmeMemoRadiSam system radical SAM enzyme, partial [Candidatus Hecatellales archaeon]
MGRILWTPCLREAVLYREEGGSLQCETCERRCLIPPGETGHCKTRINLEGKLYTLTYGDISSISANPIEKKPFYHFWPGSLALTVGSWSCNFDCPWCQNWEISKKPPKIGECEHLTPEAFLRLARAENCQGTSISFNEPTLMLEYSLDLFRLARRQGYYNTYVSNGYMTGEALELLAKAGLDAINIDVKGGETAVRKYCGADVEKVWRNAEKAKRLGIHVEITTLIIPKVNSDRETLMEIAENIAERLGPETPWHVTRYYPAYKALEVGLYPEATPLGILEEARQIGFRQGLK